ncbi:reprolysin-like metallopeptidase [Psychrobacter phenylpyruvicus]|uniref:Endo-1,3-1,4-beta-glycanase ExsH n=1 Tax=Psychrobacter phenylpyruvicus TaxID=29432 RepID=A0A379LJP8_9GAMM|nr:hypothetical protein [Psychrobacter phenylpyruvicus]SUD90836.1 Endo-1,3-1,4-beta-glycanase ExsH [Psychrobacter phenylpyruvicus]
MTTNITGTATGTAKAGDSVAVEVAGITYQTTLKTDKSFSIDITTNDLININASNVKATLTTKDLAENIITVSNETNYLAAPTNDDSMLSWTGKLSDYQDLPYFIQVLDIETYLSTNNTNHNFGYLANHYHGNESGSHSINYYFATAAEGSVYSTSRGELLNPINYTQTNKIAVNEALEILERYIDVDFNLVGSMSDADISYFMADINGGGNLDNNVTYTAGYASHGGNVHLSAEFYGDSSSSSGSLNSLDGFSTIAHETMHTMGAKHSFEEGLGSSKLSSDIDSAGLSLMSYNDDNDFHDLYDVRIYDLAYLQYRFGVNPDQRAGDDIYTFKTFNQGSVDGDIYIWDGSGTDIFDASQEQQGVYINLTPGSNIYNNIDNMNQEFFAVQGVLVDSALSYFPTEIDANENYIIVEKKDDSNNSYKVYNEIETVYDFTEGHSFIGYGTQIENLNGSEFNDTLIGNKADNVIYGGKGNDIFVIDDINDTVVELADGGIDSIFTSVDYELDSTIENLVLIGNALQGIGNELDNIIEGNNLDNTLNGNSGNDILLGGSGNDMLTGGDGSDIFLFDVILDGSISVITDFNSGDDDIIRLDSTIFDSLNPSDTSNISQYIDYDDTTGELSYDSDGSGITDPIHFVTISQGLTFEENWFSVV